MTFLGTYGILRTAKHGKGGALITQGIRAEDFRVNEAIRAPRVRLIGPDGSNLGVVTLEEALRRAREANLDLVEVAPSADPPVCRILDFGKFLYEKKKRERESKKRRVKVEIKEMRLRPRTALHDRNIKLRDAREWLQEGKKVKVVILFRGREITYPELALEDLKEIAEALSDIAFVEKPPSVEGRTMSMILAPGRRKKNKSGKSEEKPSSPSA